MNAFDLFAKLTLDSTGYDSGLIEAESKGNSFSDKLKSVLGTAGKIGAAAIGAVTTATVAMTASMVKGAGEVAVYGDNIDKMSQKMGISAEAYQEWDAVLQHSGTSIEALRGSMRTLSNAAETGNEAFAQLGITEEQVANLSKEDLFSATIEALQNMEEGTERTYIAGQLLGRGATELGALLNTSAEDTQAMKDRVHELGGVMSNEAVKAAAAFQDNLQDMQTAIAGVKRGIQSEFLPGLNSIMAGFTSLIAGEEGAEEAISEGIDNIFTAFNNVAGRVGDLAERLLPQFVNAVVSELPELFEMAGSMVLTVTDGIIDNLPMLVESSLQVVLSIANGIAENLPELIPTIVDVVIQIVETLIDNVDKLVEASVQIIVALTEGIIQALPRLIQKAPEIVISLAQAIIRSLPVIVQAGAQLLSQFIQGISNKITALRTKAQEIVSIIKNAITDLVKSALNWGRDLIENFKSGITGKLGTLKTAVSNAASTVKSFLGFSEPEEGPLSDFHTYAPDMMKLFAQGIVDNAKLLENSFNDALGFTSNVPSAKMDLGVRSAGTTGVSEPITIIVKNILDGREISETVLRYTGNKQIAYGR